MDVNVLLSRLAGVRGRNGSWVAKCPAHEDRSPSLSVKELQDGRILMHCFGGCGTDDVLGVIGLALTDLFPEPLTTHGQPRMSPVRAFTAADALRCLGREASIIALLSADIAEGKPATEDRASRAAVAAGRIAEALEMTCGQ